MADTNSINNTNTNNIFYIHENFFPEVEKKINRVIKKCEKYGNPFTFNIIGTEMREDSRADHDNKHNRYNGIFHKFIIIEVNGEAKVGNWEFIATLDVRSNGNVIRRYNNDVKLPDYFKTSPDVCDHCRTVRNRKSLYVVRNTDTGDFKQVGGDCLMSYTGIDVSYAAAIMSGIDFLCKYNNLYDGNNSSSQRYYSVKDVVSYAATIINKVGYFNVENPLPTRWMVHDMLFEGSIEKGVKELNEDLKDHSFDTFFTVEDFTTDNSEEVDTIINYYMSLPSDNEFVHNVKTIISDEYITYKDLGYLCYAPQGYAKHIEREVERAKRMTEKREHWGEVGKRYKNVPVQNIRKVASYETYYGVMHIWQIVTEDGIVLTWKSGNFPEDNASSVTFTIKEHGEYRGVPQTVVTRCKFVA